MTRRPLQLAVALALSGMLSAAGAQSLSPKQQYAADSKRIAARLSEDKKLCAEEGTSAARMQCTRDAKSEYDKHMADAKAALKAGSANKATAACHECGKVLSVSVADKAGEGSALGVIAGGVAGALLGNQVGSGHGRELATVAGAAGGAYAGNKVEQRMKSSKVWTVQVQYPSGEQTNFTFDHDPGLMAGDRVRNANGSIVRN
ncbi:glycine zipper 2TM domain-containing protein [Oxalobacteraceae bacterium]|nr:glycine zipper 2TM domain-containing protein [Oxalobacteraceae bacterium]